MNQKVKIPRRVSLVIALTCLYFLFKTSHPYYYIFGFVGVFASMVNAYYVMRYDLMEIEENGKDKQD